MISPSFIDSTSLLFRETEQISGTRDFCFMAMDSFKKSVHDFSGKKGSLENEVLDMVKLVKSTSPRISLLMFMIFKISEEFSQYLLVSPQASISDQKNKLEEIIEEVKNARKKSSEKLIKFSKDVIENGDVILLHDASHSIFDILCQAKTDKKQFSILLAEREKKKNLIIIRFLIKHNFSFQVVPEYLLSQVKATITKSMFGAVTINSLHEVISDAGTGSIVSQMKEWKIPVYVPITNDKFSLWEAKEHHTYKTKKHKISEDIEYDKLSFSHDRYPTNLVTYFITNKGILSADELNKKYDSYYKECSFWRKKNKISETDN